MSRVRRRLGVDKNESPRFFEKPSEALFTAGSVWAMTARAVTAIPTITPSTRIEGRYSCSSGLLQRFRRKDRIVLLRKYLRACWI